MLQEDSQEFAQEELQELREMLVEKVEKLAVVTFVQAKQEGLALVEFVGMVTQELLVAHKLF
ncbi:MAG: hypothetical protein WCJ81_09330 [bacterium]